MKRHLISLAIMAVIVVALLKGTIAAGYPMKFENYGSYVSRVMFLNTNGFNLYTPNWYFGYEIERYYPPSTTLLTYLGGQLLGDTSLSFNLISFVGFLVLALTLYVFLAGEFKSPLAALVATSLFVTSHTMIISNQGYFWQTPRTLGYSLIPFVLILIRIWTQKRDVRFAAAAGAMAGMVLLFNILAFTEILLIGGIYLVSRILVNEDGIKMTWKNVLTAGGVAGFAFVAIAGWWLVPAVLPDGLGSYLEHESYSWTDLVGIGDVPQYRQYLFHILSPYAIFAIAGLTAALWHRTRLSYFALSLLTIAIIPTFLHTQESRRYVLDSVLALSIMTGLLADQLLLSKKRIGLALCIAVVTIALVTAWTEGKEIFVDKEAYKGTTGYKVSALVAGMMGKDDVVYLMYADGFHDGPMAFNLHFPELSQVRGAFAAGNRNPDSKEIDSLIESGKDQKRLKFLLKKHGVTYLVVSRETLGGDDYGKLEKLYKVVAQYEKMSILYTGFSNPRTQVEYVYWNDLRIAGLIVSLLAALALMLVAKFMRK